MSGSVGAAIGVGAALGAALLAAPRRGEAGPQLDEPTRIGHLLRRAGFGASAAERAEYRALGLAGAVDRLIDFESVPDDVEAKLGMFFLDPKKLYDVQRGWVMRMLWSTRPLQEKMVLFWHGLLTSANSKVARPELMQRQAAFFRANALADYGVILKGISTDPAMMLWLDTHNSRRSAPNENYARELLELFSMGNGPFTETDVREAARAFTGWTVPRDAEAVFNPNQHDRGVKQVLGARVTTPEELIDVVVAHPATSQFIAGKLFAFFIYPRPEPDEVEPFARVFRETNGSIRAVVRAILTSELFYAPRAYRARMKSPVEYALGTLRTLGLASDGSGVIERMTRMGQTIFNPPNVAGWPGGRAWLNSGTWIERLNFANAVTALRGANGILSISIGHYLSRHEIERADDAIEHFLALLVDGKTDAEARRVLYDYLAVAPGTPVRAVPEEKLRGMLYLILAMPEHQLC
jgi:uncharacterized protein (DUF1800 family)